MDGTHPVASRDAVGCEALLRGVRGAGATIDGAGADVPLDEGEAGATRTAVPGRAGPVRVFVAPWHVTHGGTGP